METIQKPGPVFYIFASMCPSFTICKNVKCEQFLKNNSKDLTTKNHRRTYGPTFTPFTCKILQNKNLQCKITIWAKIMGHTEKQNVSLYEKHNLMSTDIYGF